MSNKRIEIIALAVLLILQSLFFVGCGFLKAYIHMDEAYSFGLSNFHSVELQDTEGFYDQWHDGAYYEDYLAVQDKDFYEYGQVYENQKNDVHPPFYYLLLRFFMGFTANRYSVWGGIALNIIVFVPITLFMYLILQRLFDGSVHKKEIALFLAVLSSLTAASVSSAMMIRMYALSTLNILIAVYLHIRLLESREKTPKLYIFIGLNALIGSLTHYYYLFFLFALYLLFVAKYVKNREYTALAVHTGCFASAGIASLIIFPHSLTHLFSGYRGQGSIDELKNANLNKIFAYLDLLDNFAFNGLLILFSISAVLLYLYTLIKKTDTRLHGRRFVLLMLLLPSLLYFTLVAMSSPYIELRYILPVCAILFVCFVFLIYHLILSIKPSIKKSILAVLLVILAVFIPMKSKTQIEPLYRNRVDVVKTVEATPGIPAVYFIDSANIRFLDDIVLFSKLDKSYITLDAELSDTLLNEIFKDADLSNGVYIFVNGRYSGEGTEWVLELISQSLGLETYTQVAHLNACRMYLFK